MSTVIVVELKLLVLVFSYLIFKVDDLVLLVEYTQFEQKIVSILLYVKLRSDLSFSLEIISPLRGKVLVDEVENEVIVLKTHRILLLTEVILQVDML